MSMFSACANPACPSTFVYSQGRLFCLRQSRSKPANSHAVRHFWLCQRCCEQYTLQERQDVGVVMVSRFKCFGRPRLIASA